MAIPSAIRGTWTPGDGSTLKRKATIHTPLTGPTRCVSTNVRARPSSDLLSLDRFGINQSIMLNEL
jgi:hypothetical protein